MNEKGKIPVVPARIDGKRREKMKQPGDLGEKKTIGLVAPSFGCTTEPYRTRLKTAIERWKKEGNIVLEGENIWKNDGVCASNVPEERAREFLDMYEGQADVLFSVGGGEVMCEMLPYVDFERIKKLPPKWFVGFSDNTNLTFTLTTLSDLVTIYGPCAGQFFQDVGPTRDTMRLLEGWKDIEGYPLWEKESLATEENPLASLNLTEKKVIASVDYEKPVEGILLGGCLDCLVTLSGTRYDRVKEFVSRQENGIIWFLEACDLSPLAIRRALFQLREAGWFENAKAFLIGRPLCYDADILGVNRHNAVLDILRPLHVPLLMDIDLGHFSPSMPIKCGARAQVSLGEGNIHIHYFE